VLINGLLNDRFAAGAQTLCPRSPAHRQKPGNLVAMHVQSSQQ